MAIRMVAIRVFSLIMFMVVMSEVASAKSPLPPGFVYLSDIRPDIIVDLRYLSADNFVGQPIDGYEKTRCIMTRRTANALAKVQTALQPLGLGLKVYDAYRPQRAVNHFVRWARNLTDTKMKSKYYPRVAKKNLFKHGYIAARSGHSRGSTVDLTLVEISADGRIQEVDMGSRWDFFSPLSWPSSPRITSRQRTSRLQLRAIMRAHGFKPYSKEWWHFTLKNEPFRRRYFNFPVR